MRKIVNILIEMKSAKRRNFRVSLYEWECNRKWSMRKRLNWTIDVLDSLRFAKLVLLIILETVVLNLEARLEGIANYIIDLIVLRTIFII